MTHLLYHWLGLDTQQSPYYDFWSGFGAALAGWVGVAIGFAGLALGWIGLRAELTALREQHAAVEREIREHRAAREPGYEISDDG